VALSTHSPTSSTGPRWHYQGSFLQTRQPAFWLFVGLLALSTLLFVAEQVLVAAEFTNAWVASWVLVVLYAIPVWLVIHRLDLFEREPRSLMLAALGWGGIVSIALAGLTNPAWSQIVAKLGGAASEPWIAAIVAPPVEELVKYLGVVLLFLIARSEFDDVLDGFVYGAIIGLGFTLTEDVGYFMEAVQEAGAGDAVGPVLVVFYIRVVASGLYMHVLWTALSGLGFAYAVTQTHVPRNRRILVAVGAFAIAGFGHFFWNSPILEGVIFAGVARGDFPWVQLIMHGLVKGLPFLVFVALLVKLAHRREHRWFKHLLEREIGTDAVTQDEAAVLGDLRARRAARKAASKRQGKGAERVVGRLQREQINLAMVCSRVGTDDHPDLEAQRELIRRIRAELSTLPSLPADRPSASNP